MTDGAAFAVMELELDARIQIPDDSFDGTAVDCVGDPVSSEKSVFAVRKRVRHAGNSRGVVNAPVDPQTQQGTKFQML